LITILKIIILLLSIYLVIHSIRDLMQYKDIRNTFTEFGHDFGIKTTNYILGLFGLTYKVNLEKYFSLMNFSFGVCLFLIYLKL